MHIILISDTAFNIKLDNHKKDVNNPKSIPANFHLKKHGYLFNLNFKIVLMEPLIIINRTIKDTLKFRFKHREDF